ncbi:GNAT family N-acetyltransferase [Nonomuraea sp. M3C6]|uniref:GNAT family N-acetyltransferase n=1 Tax=Nonomuraea marmarensis TaxID=3351344 RepID=A0ABW7AY14_9ACTN
MNDVRTFDGSGPVEVGIAVEGDLPGIVDLLNEVAATSIASFDVRPIRVDERRAWFEQFSSAGPYRLLVARRDSQVVGYASSQRYRNHEAFQETVELSISIDAGCRALGVGTSLYRALFESLAEEPIHVVVVGIAMPNDASVALHRKFGFTEVGTFHEYAAKNGRYINSLWMERLFEGGPHGMRV